MLVRVELTGKQYAELMHIMQKKALEVMAWQASPGGMLRTAEYALIVEILEALREAKEVG